MSNQNRQILSTAVTPNHYHLHLYNIDVRNFTYSGRVEIDLDVHRETDIIELNSKELTYPDDDLGHVQQENGHPIPISSLSTDSDKQTTTLELSSKLKAGTPARLMLFFVSSMNSDMAGFYRSSYKSQSGAQEYMFSTQFEACDARRAFPCFDEPNRKATFSLTISAPVGYDVLSNMPIETKQEVPGRPGSLEYTFEKSPKMSTYLLAWAIGKFEYIEAFTKREYNGKPLPVRVYTTHGLKEQARLALETAVKVVDYYSEAFDIDYPLPKLDMIAVHDFASNAMEHWGLVTYRVTALLFDEKTSDPAYKTKVVYVIAHELAHQWFGNLVTMDWWSELWLNEGFATWMGWLAVDHLYPEWDVWAQFVTEGYQTALGLDSLRGSHPIEVQLDNALQVDQIFDEISYLKGSSVIRMLSAELGLETFLKGVSVYLKKHVYSNATTEDLWAALGEASGRDVSSFMNNWITKIGFPVLTVAEEPGQISIKQSRFLVTGDVQATEDETIWWTPLLLNEGSQKEVKELSAKATTIANFDTSFYKLNSGQSAFYRVNYPAERLKSLGQQKDKLSVADRIGIIADAGAMAASGYGTTASVLELLAAFKDETNYFVWSEIISQLSKIRSVFSVASPDVQDGLRKLALSLVGPAVDRVGWEAQPGEDILAAKLRVLLIDAAGKLGYEPVVKVIQERFHAYFHEGKLSAIPSALRSAIFGTAVGEGGADEFEAVFNEYKTTTSIDGKEICLAALGRTKHAKLQQSLTDIFLSSAVKPQDKRTPAVALAENPLARELLWSVIKTRWPDVRQQLGGGIIFVLERFLKFTLSKMGTQAILEEVQEFFREKDTQGYDRGITVAVDFIKANVAWVGRDEGLVAEYLRVNV